MRLIAIGVLEPLTEGGAALGMVGWNLRDWPELTDQILAEQETLNARFLRGTVSGAGASTSVTLLLS